MVQVLVGAMEGWARLAPPAWQLRDFGHGWTLAAVQVRGIKV